MHSKKAPLTWAISFAAVATTTVGTLVWQSQAADSKDGVIKEVMKVYHKAPKGVDPICKKASDGKATPDELKKLLMAYRTLTSAKPPKGDEASWKEKTSKLVAATESLQKGTADGIAKYKEAVNCKACHSVHKPQ